MSNVHICKSCWYEGRSSLQLPCVTCVVAYGVPTNFKPKQEKNVTNTMKSAEDEARELLTRLSVPLVSEFTSSELACLSELIVDSRELKRLKSIKMAEEMAPILSATDAVAKMMDYSHPLYEAFDDAVKQATKGKGERHGGDKTPFMDQRWHSISKSTGVGGLMYQMAKKAEEACEKDDQEAFERELLGALVYGGAAYLYVKKHGFKK